MTTPTKVGLDTDPGWMTPYGKGEKEFDPNQPRDERGQWTDEGGGGGEQPVVYGVDSGYAFHDQNDEWAAGLPQSDRRALVSYAGFESDEINAIQRGDEAAVRADLAQYHMPSSYDVGHGAPNVVDEKGVQERIDQIKAEAATISRVIDDGPVMKEDTEVYRGLSLSKDDFEKMVKDGKLDDPGFQSTMVGLEDRARGYAILDQGHHELAVRDPAWARSLDKEYPTRESVFARIVVPKGTHYADIEAARRLSSSPGYKGESEILLKGASYTVESVTRDAGRLSYDAQRGITVPYHEVTLIYHPLKTKEFDPNQPRDERGQWTSEGTGEEYTVGGFAVWQPPVSSRRQVEATIREINKWPKNKDPWVPNTNNERMFGTAAFSVTQQDATGSMGEPAAYLSLDLVRSTERGSNDVIRGMNELTKIADKHQVTIVLDAVSFNINEHFTPSPMSQEKLFKFYEHFGFRKTMPGVSNHMARAPRAPKR